jgi:hypothetical protein
MLVLTSETCSHHVIGTLLSLQPAGLISCLLQSYVFMVLPILAVCCNHVNCRIRVKFLTYQDFCFCLVICIQIRVLKIPISGASVLSMSCRILYNYTDIQIRL